MQDCEAPWVDRARIVLRVTAKNCGLTDRATGIGLMMDCSGLFLRGEKDMMSGLNHHGTFAPHEHGLSGES